MRTLLTISLATALLGLSGLAFADLVPSEHEECKMKKTGEKCTLEDGSHGTCETIHVEKNGKDYRVCGNVKPLLWSDLHPEPSAQPGKTEAKSSGCSIGERGENGAGWIGVMLGMGLLLRMRKR